MPYQVHWRWEAEEELARLYLATPREERSAVTLSCAQIEQALRYAPDQFGVELLQYPGRWVYAAPTIFGRRRLAVLYLIYPEDMRVFVWQVYAVTEAE